MLLPILLLLASLSNFVDVCNSDSLPAPSASSFGSNHVATPSYGHAPAQQCPDIESILLRGKPAQGRVNLGAFSQFPPAAVPDCDVVWEVRPSSNLACIASVQSACEAQCAMHALDTFKRSNAHCVMRVPAVVYTHMVAFCSDEL